MPNNTKKTLPLSLGALGVVYGDLGTSPLYALQQVFPNMPLTFENILGVLSLVFWSLILVISICYMTVFLRADNEGEGGILALLSLLKRHERSYPQLLFLIGIVGAGLLLGDGMLTPAISVISAIEGLKVISPYFSYLIVPLSFFLLLCLFLFQRFGTGKIGSTFGPILFCWFITIGILGGVALFHNPVVLYAINPYYAFKFFYHGGWHAYILLSGVFLVITGAEAMYADLGHFGRTPIRVAWFVVVFPALFLNYFGQGAYLLENPQAISNSFYALAPSWFSYPLIIIATIATIIASQGIISASFSLAKQAILLNVCPRLSIIHTSRDEKGQVYVPQINFILAFGTLLLVVILRSSGALAAAFGMAVNLVMIIVTILVIFVARLFWNWSLFKIIWVFSLFMLIDLMFLGANLHKINQGAWIPLVFASLTGVIMITWNKGMKLLRSSYYMNKMALPEIIKKFEHEKLNHIEDLTAIFITDPYDKSGGTFLHYLDLNHMVPRTVLIVSIVIENYPYLPIKKRYELETLTSEIYDLKLHYGFMQRINVPYALSLCDEHDVLPFSLDVDKATFLVERINITKKKRPRLFYWQKKMFVFLLNNSAFDIDFFHLPHDRTITIGTYCEI
ncbi:KUP system potassium uptake protein [Legionella lansingensis]|uniref:Probable potassium transport system protein Kup n=1 Tax=Legionella lansingensis TaxID=45067 RepID=A0A0W0VF71_9GAMM|nr:KUP/HAK/KT family potassium transporter [Legionella lansingensis]KTD18746.1 KUP system potassium uptake protein [Legionella lansingensis]SNV58454.1 KUP system potassium uptake protein [Legionella lansingensis]